MSDSADAVTRAVRAGLESDEVTGAVVPPIHLSATYAFRGYGEKRGYDYSRSGNPTRDLLEEALAELEGGAGAVVTASGMAAVTLCVQVLPARARLVAPHDCYGGTYRLFDALGRRGDIELDCVNFGDDEALRRALSRPAAMLWIETPSNPLLRLTDIATVARLGKSAGALVVVDNTFLSPAWQQPLSLGADLVVHSTTKYINGHSDVVGGAVVAARTEQFEQLYWWANSLGLTGAAFDSFMTLRGLRTLHARLAVHGRNALAIADWLARQRHVRKVYYPGLPSHPGHDHCAAAAVRVRRHRELRAGGRRGRGQGLRLRIEILLARRIARRCGEPDRASGLDDSRGDERDGTAGRRTDRRAAASVGRHRGARGFARRSGGWTGALLRSLTTNSLQC